MKSDQLTSFYLLPTAWLHQVLRHAWQQKYVKKNQKHFGEEHIINLKAKEVSDIMEILRLYPSSRGLLWKLAQESRRSRGVFPSGRNWARCWTSGANGQRSTCSVMILLATKKGSKEIIRGLTRYPQESNPYKGQWSHCEWAPERQSSMMIRCVFTVVDATTIMHNKNNKTQLAEATTTRTTTIKQNKISKNHLA